MKDRIIKFIGATDMRKLLPIVFVLLAMPMMAEEFTVTIEGRVSSKAGYLAGAKVSAHAQPFWGRQSQKALDEYEKTNGKLPTIAVSGEGVSDSNGYANFEVTISWDSEEGEIPVVIHKNRDGSQEDRAHLYIILATALKGYRNGRTAFKIFENQKSTPTINLYEDIVIKGKLVFLRDRQPVANVKLALVPASYRPPTGRNRRNNRRRQVVPLGKYVPPQRIEITTAKDGTFEVSNPNFGSTATLVMADERYAFNSQSKAWSTQLSTYKSFDFETLAITAGGSLKFRTVTMDSKSPVFTTAYVQNKLDQPRFSRSFDTETDGHYTIYGLPLGNYTLSFKSNTSWPAKSVEFNIKSGEMIKLGDLEFEPFREIEVIAVGPEEGIASYGVIATFLGENPPVSHYRSDQKYSTRGNLSVENSKLTRLFSGKWEIAVDAPGYSIAVTSVEIPKSTTITVLLEKSAKVTCFLDDAKEKQTDNLYAVVVDSNAHTLIDSFDRDYFNQLKWDQQSKPKGLIVSRYRNTFGRLRAGKYIFLAIGPHGNVVKSEELELKPGDELEVVLKGEPGYLKIIATFDGQPFANEPLVILGEGQRYTDTVVKAEVTTDDLGRYTYEVENNGKLWVLRKIDYLYLTTLYEEGYEFDQHMKKPTLGFIGKTVEKELMLTTGLNGIFRLEIESSKLQKITRVRITPIAENGKVRHRSYGSQGALIDGQWIFIGLKSGNYNVATHIESGKSFNDCNNKITISESKDQTQSVIAELYAIAISIETSMDTKGHELRIWFFSEVSNYQINDYESYIRSSTLVKNRTCTIGALKPGKYVVLLSVSKEDRRTKQTLAVNGMSVEIEVSKNDTLTLNLSSDVGMLDVELSMPQSKQTTSLGAVTRGMTPVVLFKNGKGEFVKTQLPQAQQIRHIQRNPDKDDDAYDLKASIISIPAGTYTTYICIPGYLPVIIKDVEIKKGRLATVNAEPKLAGSVVVALSNINLRKNTSYKYSFEDSDGNELTDIEIIKPAGHILRLVDGRDGTELVATNLNKKVRRIRVEIDGYEPILVDIDVKLGRTVKLEYECKVKAD